ncbi:DUF397 domain-containing protein [Amycolatopsis sp. cmx-11-12]|uniref:DUF397 domain-containing protein n=1 Tax=Amycolatopsis sp. cmx-11-12 TaxID=2785795 RepID=UPI0039186210
MSGSPERHANLGHSLDLPTQQCLRVESAFEASRMRCTVEGVLWRKSTYSGEDVNKTDCVEPGRRPGSRVTYVRDNGDPEGGTFLLSPEAWNGLLETVRRDDN